MTDWVGSFSPTLKFVVKDCDPATGEPDSDEGYGDEYVLEDLEVSVPDFVQRIMKGNFAGMYLHSEIKYCIYFILMFCF